MESTAFGTAQYEQMQFIKYMELSDGHVNFAVEESGVLIVNIYVKGDR